MLWIPYLLLSLSFSYFFYQTKNLEYIKLIGLFTLCFLIAEYLKIWVLVYTDNILQAKIKRKSKNKRLKEKAKSWAFNLDDLYKTLDGEEE